MVTNVVSVCWDDSAVTGPSEAWSWLYTLSNGCGFDTDGSHAESRTGRASAPLYFHTGGIGAAGQRMRDERNRTARHNK